MKEELSQWVKDHRWFIIALLLLYSVATIPFFSRSPLNWDAAQFVLGVEHFSVHMHQPHPPGYPLFIAMGKLLNVVMTPHAALVLISAVFGALSVVALYLLARDLWPERKEIAFLVACAWIFNPLFWLYRETAVTYTIDAASGLIIAWLALRTLHERRHRYSIASVVVIAVASGFRPSLLVLLFPLIAFQLWFHKRNWRFIVLVFLLGVLLSLAWFVPLITFSGGLQQYLIDSQKLYKTVSEQTSILAGAQFENILRQVQLLATTLVEAWNVIVIPMVVSGSIGLYAVWKNGIKMFWHISGKKIMWLFAWLLPSVIVLSFIHLGQLGYTLIVLPAGYLALGPILLRLREWSHAGLVVLTVGFLAVHSLVFLWLRPTYAHPEFIPRDAQERIMQRIARITPNGFRMNRHVIAEQDAKHEAYRKLLLDYNPETTIIVTGRGISYTSPINGLVVRNDELFRELSAITPEYRIIELGQNRSYYLEAYQATMSTIYAQTIVVPTETRDILFALSVIPDDRKPENIIIERTRLLHVPHFTYHGIMDKPWRWLGFTIEYASPL